MARRARLAPGHIYNCFLLKRLYPSQRNSFSQRRRSSKKLCTNSL
jgi:hypothetical protein